MKHLLLIVSLYITGYNASAQCDPSAFVISLSPGITSHGAVLSIEGGFWPVVGRVGVLVGPLMYDENISSGKATEAYTRIDFSGRLIYKLTRYGSRSPQLLTAFATVRGLVGVSYRSYWSVSEDMLVGIEPGYSRLGAGVNLLITMRL